MGHAVGWARLPADCPLPMEDPQVYCASARPDSVRAVLDRLPASDADVDTQVIEVRATMPFEIPLTHGRMQPDGRLDEPFWREAWTRPLLYEISLAENRPAPVETRVFMIMLDDALAIAFVALDPEPQQIRVTLTDRDRLRDDDRVWVVLDTFGDQRHAYEIFVNPYGIQADALRYEGSARQRRRGPPQQTEDFNFDFLWEAGARIYSDGYIVEIRIPLRYLRFVATQKGTAIWRIGAFREYPRDFAYRLSLVPWDFNRNCFICQLPEARVPIPVRPRRLTQWIPYVRGMHERQREEDTAATYTDQLSDAAAGLDIKFQPSPQWVMDATLNPDFSQVETDVFQITSNLRFAPFYPEKRPFFLERTDLLQTPLQVVYTRRLVDPLYGVRVTGKTGPHTLAVLHLLDRQTSLIFPDVLTSRSTTREIRSWNTIVRYRYDVGRQSMVGVLLTDREWADGWNRTAGIDSFLFLSRTWTLSGQAIWTHTRYSADTAARFDQPTDPFQGWGYALQFNHPGRNWEFRAGWQELTEGFRADTGFIQQVGVRQMRLMNAFIFWPNSGWLKRISLFTFANATWDRRQDLQTGAVSVGTFIRGGGQTSILLRGELGRDRVENIDIPTARLVSFVRSAPTRWFQGELFVEYGTAPDYTLALQAQMLNVRVRQQWLLFRRVAISQQVRYQRLWESGPLQDAVIAFLRIEWQFTRRLGVRQIVQWQRFRYFDPRYRAHQRPEHVNAWEVQSLLRYRINYATALYAGFYGRWSSEPEERSRRWNAFVKISYLLNW